ncbi:hypothetical protein COT78_04270, partial [Candidatus Berkelbacteria bacterium CG10_big_fil_rev_8_21_14_0_10_43_13]
VLPRVNLQKIKSLPIFLIIVYIFWILLSYFWSEASTLQWLRGVRFSAVPMLFLLTLSLANFTQSEKKSIFKSVIWVSVFIVTLSIPELIGVKLPLVTAISSQGTLSADHFVGAANLHRLQSVLAGPNAFGLYLLVLITIVLSWGKELKTPKWLIWVYFLIAILTFSRSVWIGLVVLSFVALVSRYKFRVTKVAQLIAILLIVCAGIFVLARKSATVNQIVTHGVSTNERFAEYKRIWQTRHDIGLLGRGAGDAGPTTQNRLDDGPNYWTESTYLDTFEEFGLIGLLLFISIIVLLWRKIVVAPSDNPTFRTARLLVPAFLVAGLFISLYTGQVAVYTFLLILGSADSNEEQLE